MDWWDSLVSGLGEAGDYIGDFFVEDIPEFGSDVVDVFQGDRIGQNTDGSYVRGDDGLLDSLGGLFSSGGNSNTPSNNTNSGGLLGSLMSGEGGVLGSVLTAVTTGGLAGLSAEKKQKLINEAAEKDRQFQAEQQAKSLANQLLMVKMNNADAFRRDAFRNAIEAASTGGTNTATTLTNLADIAQRPLQGGIK